MSEAIDISGISVMIAMPVRNLRDICIPTMLAREATFMELDAYGIDYGCNTLVGGLIEHARSRAVAKFLTTKYNRLFFVDSDLGWQAPDFMKFLAYSTSYEVITAAYRAKRDPPFYMWNPGDGELMVDRRGCLSVTGNGLGFTCIQRTVLEQLSAKAPVRKHPPKGDVFPDVFRFDRIGEQEELRGEDFSFFADVRELGYKVMLDPSIELSHLGDKEYTGRVSDNLRREQPPAQSGALPPQAAVA